MNLSSRLEPVQARDFIRYQPSGTDKTKFRDPSRRGKQDLSIVIAGLDPAIRAEQSSFDVLQLAQEEVQRLS